MTSRRDRRPSGCECFRRASQRGTPRGNRPAPARREQACVRGGHVKPVERRAELRDIAHGLAEALLERDAHVDPHAIADTGERVLVIKVEVDVGFLDAALGLAQVADHVIAIVLVTLEGIDRRDAGAGARQCVSCDADPLGGAGNARVELAARLRVAGRMPRWR